jgi:cell division protein FtsL
MAAPRVRASRREMPQGDRAHRAERRRGRIRVLVWSALVLGALGTVLARQTAGYEAERQLSDLRQQLSVAEAERLDLANRVQALQTRARVVRLAAERMGMHVAHDDEVVLLPLPSEDR